ncbi:hypothetical protein H4R23_002873 [Coemansia sp. Cherry 401B]|nr:hypothetical protein H4R23_002873 [Coemansia sp. Cherry 401B]
MSEHFTRGYTLYIPDIMYSAPPEFQHESFNIAPSPELAAELGLHKPVACQAVLLALRPQFVWAIRERIVYTGQTKSQGDFKWFSAIPEILHLPKVPAELSDELQIVDPVEEISADRMSAGVRGGDPSNSVEKFFVVGPRHVGKSHVMFELAALMACDPGVVVVYIGDCGELLRNGKGSSLREKYIKFIEHMVSSFCQHSFVNKLVDRWYGSTGMGAEELAMRGATRVFLRRLSDECQEHGITMVVFLDRCEEFMRAKEFEAIVTADELQHTYKAVVVATSSDPVKLDMRSVLPSYQCVVSGPMSLTDASNMCINSVRRLDITEQEMAALADGVERHALDVVGVVQKFEGHLGRLADRRLESAKLADSQGLTMEQQRRQLAITRAIAEQRQSRASRLAQMHLRFMHESFVRRAAQVDAGGIRRTGMGQNIIDTSSPELKLVEQEIKRCAFILYHELELKPGARRDPHFMVPESSASSTKSIRGPALSQASTRCHPPAARIAMYHIHFRGRVREQFAWLFESQNRFDVETPIRQRYFDLLVLESGSLRGRTSNPLQDSADTPVSIDFTFVGQPDDGFEFGFKDPRDCTTFADAIGVVSHHIQQARHTEPAYLPRTGQTELEQTIMLYFPRLELNEEWMGAAQAETHFRGSYMVAIRRVDAFALGASDRLCGYSGCRFDVTWIASDPIHVKTAACQAEQAARVPPGKRGRDDAPLAPQEPMLRDTVDFDGKFGSEQSWSAKAVRLFPHIRRETLAMEGAAGALGGVRLLGLVAEPRVRALIQDKQRPLARAVDKGEYSGFIDDIGMLSTFSKCFGPEVKQHI